MENQDLFQAGFLVLKNGKEPRFVRPFGCLLINEKTKIRSDGLQTKERTKIRLGGLPKNRKPKDSSGGLPKNRKPQRFVRHPTVPSALDF
ncbi:unnamed protein product [Rhizophagus irregularis]|nr:unnamed protein product [Rhizophagus irregularis]